MFPADIIARIELRVRWVADFELMLLAQVLDVPVTSLLAPPRAMGRNLAREGARSVVTGYSKTVRLCLSPDCQE